MKKDFVEYSIALQRAIESHCRGEIIPDDILVLCPHHGEMLNKAQKTIHNNKYKQLCKDCKHNNKNPWRCCVCIHNFQSQFEKA